jgi:hypothetical protein
MIYFMILLVWQKREGRERREEGGGRENEK